MWGSMTSMSDMERGREEGGKWKVGDGVKEGRERTYEKIHA